MTHRRPALPQRDLEDGLRRALLGAVDSIEPAVGGLDRIRTRISARHRARFGWNMTDFAPAAIWLQTVCGAVVDRFRPNPASRVRYGWLRPAAALATGIFVVAAGSWAATT